MHCGGNQICVLQVKRTACIMRSPRQFLRTLWTRNWGLRTRTRTCKLVLDNPRGQGLSSRTMTPDINEQHLAVIDYLLALNILTAFRMTSTNTVRLFSLSRCDTTDDDSLMNSSETCIIIIIIIIIYPLSSTWPHLNSDVGLEKGEY